MFWDAPHKQWMEWRVAVEKENLVWVQGELSSECRDFVPELSNDLADVLPNKFTTEISPAAINWWKRTAKSLEKGRLVAIDYGLMNEEFFRPDRSNGTARAYYKHRLCDDLLDHPGEQVLTTHVNWTAIQKAGEDAGLETELFCSQEQFLMNIVKGAASENWSAENIKQLKTLTHPGFLGRAFRVLVQKRD
jgi:SAM-dependent MidA family methyltransferase